MNRRCGCALLVMVQFGAAAPAAADPITIVERSSGIAVLAIASDGGLTERRSFPYTPSEDISRTLTSTAGTTASTASATLQVSTADPSRMGGSGSATAAFQTTTGWGDVSGAAWFAVDFLLDTPHAFAFSGDFTATGHESRDPFISEIGRWDVSLTRGTAVVFAGQGFQAQQISPAGLLAPGLYHLLVQSGATGSNAFGPAAIDSASSFAFTFDLSEVDPAAVPEPASLILLGTGLAGTLAAARRRRVAR